MQQNLMGLRIDDSWQWIFRRNCSISPKQMAIIFAFLACISLIIGISFYVAGALLILPFSCLEIIALVIAFFYNAIHANDYEKLTIDSSFVTLEFKKGFHLTQTQLVKAFCRVDLLQENKNLIQIRQGSKSELFGVHIHANKRPLLEKELRSRI